MARKYTGTCYQLHVKGHDRSGRPDKKRDHELKRGPTKRRASNARQLGCVFQDIKPPKSILRKSSDMQKPIQTMKFTKAIARHTKIRNQNPSLGSSGRPASDLGWGSSSKRRRRSLSTGSPAGRTPPHGDGSMYSQANVRAGKVLRSPSARSRGQLCAMGGKVFAPGCASKTGLVSR